MAAYAAAGVCPACHWPIRGLRGMLLPRTGVALVAHLLQQRSPRHLSIELLHAMEALLRAVGPCEALHTAVLQRLLLNLRLWAAAPLPIQRSFQALLLKLAKAGRSPLRCASILLQACLECVLTDGRPGALAGWVANFLPCEWLTWHRVNPLGLRRSWACRGC